MGKSEEAVGAFGKLLALVRKYGWGSILKTTFFLFFVAVFVTFVFNFQGLVNRALEKYGDEKEKERTEQHDDAMKKRKEIKPRIESLMKDVMIDLGADRVFVLEMHNGTNNTSGLPFLYAELTYSKCNGSVENVDDEYEKLNLSRYEFPYYLIENECYTGSVDSLMAIDSKMARKLSISGDTYIAVCLVHGMRNDIGYMGFTFTRPLSECSIDEAMFRKRLMADSQKVSILLDTHPLSEVYCVKR